MRHNNANDMGETKTSLVLFFAHLSEFYFYLHSIFWRYVQYFTLTPAAVFTFLGCDLCLKDVCCCVDGIP